MAKPGQKPQCLALLTVHPNTTIQIAELLGNAPVCERSMARVHATRIVLQKLWSTAPAKQEMHFWYESVVARVYDTAHLVRRLDYTDGTVLSQDMFAYLQYPVLTFGKGHDDHCSMPIPQLYHLLAMIGTDEGLLEEYAQHVSVYADTVASCLANTPAHQARGGLCQEDHQGAERRVPHGAVGAQDAQGCVPRQLLPNRQPRCQRQQHIPVFARRSVQCSHAGS